MKALSLPNELARLLAVSIATISAATALFVGAEHTAAAPAWTQPVIVYQTAGYVGSPVLVADTAGDAHLLFQSTDARDPGTTTPGAIWYTRLHNGMWSRPVDVLATPGSGSTTQEAVALDSRGFLHVVWSGSTGFNTTLFYSRAHVNEAASPRAWTSPVQVSDADVTSSGPGAIAVGPDDSIHLAYATTDNRVAYRRSSDSGQTWSAPTTVGDFAKATWAPDDVRIVADNEKHLFVTWSTFAVPAGWPPTGTYFARSMDAGATWSTPARVSSANQALLTVAARASGGVYRLWYSVAEIGDHSGQFSADYGQTWTPVDRFLPQLKGGLTGFAGIGFDSLGILHVVVPASSGKSGMWATTWDGKSWSDPVFLSRGSINKRSVEQPSLAIGLGDEIHVAWEDDFQRIWYTSQLTDAPALPVRPVPPAPAPPTPVLEPTPALPITAVAVPRATSPNDSAISDPTPPTAIRTDSQPLWPILGPGVPIIVVITALVVARLRRLS